MEEKKIKVGIFIPEKSQEKGAKVPTRAYQGDVGHDVYAIEDVEVPFGEMVEIRTGIHLVLPEGVFAQVNTRSSYGKNGVILHHGVIDQGYTGEVTIWAMNVAATRDVNGMTHREPFIIRKGEKIGQLLFHESVCADWEVVKKLPKTERGDKFNASSGK
jgi:dUTP pyrophosphatase